MLVGNKVILRTVRESDLPLLYDLSADMRAMGDGWPLFMPSELRRNRYLRESGWWEENHGGLLITTPEGQDVLSDSERVVGEIDFYKTADYLHCYEISYRLYSAENQGRGYMSEAVALFVAYLFDTRPVDRLQATTLPGNTASQHILEKCGFRLEGIMRRAIFHWGQSRDLHLYAVVRGEHRPLKELLAR